MAYKKISIVLVDDHEIVRKGVKSLLELEDDFYVVGEAANGLDAIAIINLVKPNIVIMDIALPKLNGIQTSKQLLSTDPSLKILVLSAYVDDGYIEKLTDLGVCGFIAKQCAPNILTEAIREIFDGKKYFSSSVSKRFENINESHVSNEGVVSVRKNHLTNREVQVLQLIAEGMANKEVAFELKISIKTVDKHRQNVMEKLSIHDTAGLTRYAISEGIIECSKQLTSD